MIPRTFHKCQFDTLSTSIDSFTRCPKKTPVSEVNSFFLTGVFLGHPVYSKYNTSLYLILGGKFWFTHVPVTCNKTRVSSNRVHVANLSWVESAVWCVKMSKIWIEGLNVVAGDHSPHFTILKKNIFKILQKKIFSVLITKYCQNITTKYYQIVIISLS